MAMPKIEDNEIILAVKNSDSLASALKKLNIFKNGSSAGYSFLKRKIKELNLDISHFMGKAWSKGKSIFSDERVKGKLLVEEIFKENSIASRSRVRDLLISENLIPYECVCGCDGKWGEKTISLDLHHMNGKRRDNRIQNLQFLCPNCHAATDSYKGKNKIREKNYSDQEIIDTIKICENIRQVLVKLDLTEDGSNYERNRKIIEKNNVKFLITEKSLYKNICPICGKLSEYKHCSQECYKFSIRKVSRPSLEEIENLMKNNSMLSIGKMFGVTDNTVRFWIKSYKK